MKKLIAIAAACVALASCVKNEVDFSGNFAQGERIDFQAVQSVETPSRATYKTYDHFMAAAFLLNEGQTWAGAHQDAQVYFKGQKVTNTALGWTTSTAYYWPAKGSLTFYAYAPETIQVTNREWNTNKDYIFTGYSVETNKNIDFMVADIAREQTKNDVPTVFRHKLTKLSFGIAKSTNDTREITLKSIKVKGVFSEGDYTMPYNTIHGSGSIIDYWTVADGISNEVFTIFNGSQEVTDTAVSIPSSHLYMIPQEFTSTSYLEVIYEVKAGSAIETVTINKHLGDDIDTTDKQWLPNEHITYNFTIGEVQQIMWAPSEETWADQSFTIAL